MMVMRNESTIRIAVVWYLRVRIAMSLSVQEMVWFSSDSPLCAYAKYRSQ